MPTTITENSKEIVSRLIRNEFENLKFWQDAEAEKLIQTAKDFGLTELAEQMSNDLKVA